MKLTVTLPTHSYDLTIETGALDKIGTWVRSLAATTGSDYYR